MPIYFEGLQHDMQDFLALLAASRYGYTPEQVLWNLTSAIYGSNMIEAVGISPEGTIEICRSVFAQCSRPTNLEVPPFVGIQWISFPVNSPYVSSITLPCMSSYTFQPATSSLLSYTSSPVPGPGPRGPASLAREDVCNHALALMYMICVVVIRREPLSERVLRETHAILTGAVSRAIGGGQLTPSDYRTYDVSRMQSDGTRWQCAQASEVPARIAHLCRNVESDLAIPDHSDEGFPLAGKVHRELMFIRPFTSENDRLVRIVVIALILKFEGRVCTLGQQPCEAVEYMEIVNRSSLGLHTDHFGLPCEELPSSHFELSGYLLECSMY